MVRVSGKQFTQVDLIIDHLHELIECGKYDDIASRIVLVRYDHTSDANAYFSSLCDVRVIWGGIRPLPPCVKMYYRHVALMSASLTDIPLQPSVQKP